ncbi:Abi family protein [Companilactobacillus jidongensis]|uniref:Abi family protein n=1 Tax=Companilactobacillus jidongensis TaxID=2486006 RepID=UPI000F791D20|nr:Abi family protein [Companilactobacillus jidongensis]
MYKHKATYGQMIQAMKIKGISFNYISEEEAIYYLKNKNYYFKLNAFRNNFKKTNSVYENLDFQYLIAIATIDSNLREILLKMSLDIEHSLKVKLLDMITQNPNEDGYSIVKRFKGYSEWNYNETIKFMKNII